MSLVMDFVLFRDGYMSVRLKDSVNKYKLHVLPALKNYRIFSPLFDKHMKPRSSRYRKRSKYEDN